jgi:hypothetical protein
MALERRHTHRPQTARDAATPKSLHDKLIVAQMAKNCRTYGRTRSQNLH